MKEDRPSKAIPARDATRRVAETLVDLDVPAGGYVAADGSLGASGRAIEEARRIFQAELDSLAGRSLEAERLEEAVVNVTRRSEDLFTALRGVDGCLVTLKVDTGRGLVEVIPFGEKKGTARSAVFPTLRGVAISSLPDHEAAIAIAKTLGRRQATALTPEAQSRGGRAASERMTADERSERGRRAARAASERMTADERSERARHAVQARWSRAPKGCE